MALGRPRRSGDASFPGEPAIGPDLPPPFTADDEPTRWLFSLNRHGFRPGLVRIEGLLADLGHPERELRTLTVAGTNGKGSTTRILDCLLRGAGHRTGAYTSPHLLNVRERIRIDDVPVAADEFADRIEAIRPLVEKHEASWFETLTALAVWIVRDAGVDFLCCETGLGGRLDASNALPPVAVLLTTVGLDHQRILGETREQILDEKLGLLKRGVPLFCGVDADLRGQVFRAAVNTGSPCLFLDELTRFAAAPASADTGSAWDLTLRDEILAGLPDPGTEHLRRDVALALWALHELQQRDQTRLLPEDPAAVLGNLFLPGRYQQVLGGPDWIFDTAHNEQALAFTLREFAQDGANGRRIVLFGGMYDKGLPPELGDLMRGFDLVLGAPVALPRSRTPEELAELFAAWDLVPQTPETAAPESRCLVLADTDAALARLARDLRPEDRVLVTGSCFTVAEVLHKLGFDDLDRTRQMMSAASVLSRLKESA